MRLAQKFGGGQQDIARVDITPMIDIVFQLLIFLIILAQMALCEVTAELKLPEARYGNPETQQEKDRLIVNVDDQGLIYVANQRMTPQELRGTLTTLAQESMGPDGFASRPVFIRADLNLAFGKVQDVMEICRDVRIWRLSLRAKTPVDTLGNVGDVP
jgi:biopolymer transport protein ExbD